MGTLLLTTAPAQTLVPKSPFVLNFDYSRFRYTDSLGYFEVYYTVYPALVALEPDTAGYRGAVELRTVIRNTDTDSIFVDQRSLLPIHVRDTTAEAIGRAIVGKLIYALPMGNYRMEVIGQEPLVPTRRDSGKVVFSLSPVPDVLSVSDVDLCSNIQMSDRKDDPFYKNSYAVIPNPSLLFGTGYSPVVFTYAEFYNLNTDSTYAVSCQVLDGKGKVIKRRNRVRQFKVRNAVDVSLLNVTDVRSGKYRFALVVSDTNGREFARTEKPIFIYNPGLVEAANAGTSARAAELAGMSADELADEFSKAQYIATDQENSLFGKVTSAEGRREFLAKFWTDVEGGRLGQRELTRRIYLDRVSNADQRYSTISRHGWKTDRGRVYVLYGEPDEIQRFPSSEDSKPYEIWNYYHVENGVEFVFVDRTGFGDYSLVHSTKRGELQDDTWQRYLR